MNYHQKLLDPRWQKLRLQVLERDNWSCELCQDKETTLHIHHFCYRTSGNPWESELDELITYCKHCHAFVEINNYKIGHPYKVIKVKITEDIVGLAVFYLCNHDLFNLYYYSESVNKIEYITTLPRDFIENINFQFNHVNTLLNG